MNEQDLEKFEQPWPWTGQLRTLLRAPQLRVAGGVDIFSTQIRWPGSLQLRAFDDIASSWYFFRLATFDWRGLTLTWILFGDGPLSPTPTTPKRPTQSSLRPHPRPAAKVVQTATTDAAAEASFGLKATESDTPASRVIARERDRQIRRAAFLTTDTGGDMGVPAVSISPFPASARFYVVAPLHNELNWRNPISSHALLGRSADAQVPVEATILVTRDSIETSLWMRRLVLSPASFAFAVEDQTRIFGHPDAEPQSELHATAPNYANATHAQVPSREPGTSMRSAVAPQSSIEAQGPEDPGHADIVSALQSFRRRADFPSASLSYLTVAWVPGPPAPQGHSADLPGLLPLANAYLQMLPFDAGFRAASAESHALRSPWNLRQHWTHSATGVQEKREGELTEDPLLPFFIGITPATTFMQRTITWTMDEAALSPRLHSWTDSGASGRFRVGRADDDPKWPGPISGLALAQQTPLGLASWHTFLADLRNPFRNPSLIRWLRPHGIEAHADEGVETSILSTTLEMETVTAPVAIDIEAGHCAVTMPSALDSAGISVAQETTPESLAELVSEPDTPGQDRLVAGLRIGTSQTEFGAAVWLRKLNAARRRDWLRHISAPEK